MPEVLPTVGRGDPGDVPVVPAAPVSCSQFRPVRRCAAGKGAPSTAMAREAPSRAPNHRGGTKTSPPAGPATPVRAPVGHAGKPTVCLQPGTSPRLLFIEQGPANCTLH